LRLSARGEGSSPPPARLPCRNPARGGDGGGGRGPGAAVQTCFLPPAAAAARAPVCGCVPRPAHPPHPLLGGWGRLFLKGSERGSGARGLGPWRGRGWGRGAECRRVSHVRPTYSRAPTGSRSLGPGATGAFPCPGRGPRCPDKPRSSFLSAVGLGLMGLAVLLPQLSLGPESCVVSGWGRRGGGGGGGGGWYSKWLPSVCVSDCRPPRAPPSDSSSRLFSRLPWLFPTSCFLPGSGAMEGCLEWGRWGGPPGGWPACSSSATTHPFRPP
jgi:hypothetical protein